MRPIAIVFHRSFEKNYARQSAGTKKAFSERRNLFLIDSAHPLLNNHPLRGKWKGYFSINVSGDFRAVYFLKNAVAVFVALDTHSKLYR